VGFGGVDFLLFGEGIGEEGNLRSHCVDYGIDIW
jgi:hypothetical protein